jgi:hypothetical protein
MWSRVFLDEVQDLVRAGGEEQKCLLQLTRGAAHVWLMSATPFPHGNASVVANHELLGFQARAPPPAGGVRPGGVGKEYSGPQEPHVTIRIACHSR